MLQQLLVRFCSRPVIAAVGAAVAVAGVTWFVTGRDLEPLIAALSGIGGLLTLFTARAVSAASDQVRPSTAPAALFSLPPDITDFTGRDRQLKQVVELLERAARGRGTAIAISAVAGMAGVGKSTLAIRAAHRVRRRFPEAQLYVNLRGAEGQAREPVDVLAGFLRALGVAEGDLPDDLEGRAALYRARLSDKRALVLLDNARDERQVTSLLPGSPTCAVLITSRVRLTALGGARMLDLEVMSEREALALLERLVGAARVRVEHGAAGRLIVLCGRLPLAVRIAGGTLAAKSKSDWRLADYVRLLNNERERLARLRLADLNVRASFALSYGDLTASDARLFRLLGLVPGADFAGEAAAVLLESDDAAARDALGRLVDMQLVEPAGEGRYRFHDLMRLFAQEGLADEEPGEAQQVVKVRLAHWYADEATSIGRWLDLEGRRQDAQQLAWDMGSSTADTERLLPLRALAWFDRERASIWAVMEWAHEAQDWKVVQRLVKALAEFRPLRTDVAQFTRAFTWRLDAERMLGDRQGEGQALTGLGRVYEEQGRWDEAIRCFEQGLAVFQELGDRQGEGRVLTGLGIVYERQNRWDEAIRCFEASLSIKRELGDRQGEGEVLSAQGMVYEQQGRLDEADIAFREALTKLHPDSPEYVSLIGRLRPK